MDVAIPLAGLQINNTTGYEIQQWSKGTASVKAGTGVGSGNLLQQIQQERRLCTIPVQQLVGKILDSQIFTRGK